MLVLTDSGVGTEQPYFEAKNGVFVAVVCEKGPEMNRLGSCVR